MAHRKSEKYFGLKISIITLTGIALILIIGVVIFYLYSAYIVVQVLKQKSRNNPKTDVENLTEMGWQTLKLMVIIPTVITGIIYTYGVFAVAKSSYYLVVIYNVFLYILTVLSIPALLLLHFLFIAVFIVDLILAVLTSWYAIGIKRERDRLPGTYLATQQFNYQQGQVTQDSGYQKENLAMQTLNPNSLSPNYNLNYSSSI